MWALNFLKTFTIILLGLNLTACPFGGKDKTRVNGQGDEVSTDPQNESLNITSYSLENNNLNVPLQGAVFTFTFNLPITESSIIVNSGASGTDSIRLVKTENSEEIEISYSIEGSNRTLNLTANLPLEDNTSYYIEINPNLYSTDNSGTAVFMDSISQFTFTTEAASSGFITTTYEFRWRQCYDDNSGTGPNKINVNYFTINYGRNRGSTTSSRVPENFDYEFNFSVNRLDANEVDGKNDGYTLDYSTIMSFQVIPGTNYYYAYKACNNFACSLYSKEFYGYYDESSDTFVMLDSSTLEQPPVPTNCKVSY